MLQFKTFLEIGACDFDTCLDFVRNRNWVGVIIEPHPIFAERIRRIIEAESLPVILLEVAVSHSSYDSTLLGPTEDAILSYDKDDAQTWIKGISTVANQSHNLISHNIKLGYFDPTLFIEYPIKCISLDDIVATYCIDTIDYMKVDTEGHELEIFNSYSWDIRPEFMKIEHKHVDNVKLIHLLRNRQYNITVEQDDLYCIKL